MALNPALLPSWTPGRDGSTLLRIVMHHWGVLGQLHDNVARYLRNNGRTDAHAVISANKITRLVDESDTAWHAGNWLVNTQSIGLECRPECSPGDFQTVAEEIARIRRRHGWLPLTGHKDHFATSCPGLWYPRLAELSARADAINAGKIAAQPSTPPKLAVDGDWGPKTTSALQIALGTLADGEVSDQWAPHAEHWPGVVGGWEWGAGIEGSAMVAALQRHLGGLKVDGLAGPVTAKALQTRLGVTADGYVGPITAKALQTRLNTGKI